MGIGEVIGATLALRKAAGAMRASTRVSPVQLRADRSRLLAFADPAQIVLPRVTFEEAVDDMVKRTPVTLKNAAERTAARIGQLYREEKVMAFVRSADDVVTKRVQDLFSMAIRDGITEASVGRLAKGYVDFIREETEPWTEGYARMAFRTNLNTASTAGRFRQVEDPDVAEVIPALMFSASMDADTRPNHAAANGVIMTTKNPDWAKIAPPLGYQCRCTADFVSKAELEDLNRIRRDGQIQEDRIPAGAHPDPGFVHGGRPDKAMALL